MSERQRGCIRATAAEQVQLQMLLVARHASLSESLFIRKQVLSWEYWLRIPTLVVRLLETDSSVGCSVGVTAVRLLGWTCTLILAIL